MTTSLNDTSSPPLADDPIDFRQFVSDANHVPRDVLAFLVMNPFAGSSDPDAIMYAQAMKLVVEMHASEINGLVTGWKLDPVTGVVKNPTTQVEFVFNEKYGRPIEDLMYAWMVRYAYAVMHEWIRPTAKIVFIEPDATTMKPVSVWVGADLFPLSTGNEACGRNLQRIRNAAIIKPQLSGNFTYNTPEALSLAQKLFDELNARPTDTPAFTPAFDLDYTLPLEAFHDETISRPTH